VLDVTDPSIDSRLRGLLDVAGLVHGERDLPALLDELARTVGETLGFGTVAVSLYRAEWNELQVAAVHGDDDARDALLGESRSLDAWAPLLDERRERCDAYVIADGGADVLVPLRSSDGLLLGLLSVEEPGSGRVPSDGDLDVLVAVATHASLAIQSAQEAARAERHRAALEQLLAVAAGLDETRPVEEVLTTVCDAVREALGFGAVAVDLRDPEQDRYVTAARSGSTDRVVPLPRDDLEALLASAQAVDGCHLVAGAPGRSRLNGRGPHAWSDHLLLVPLAARDGGVAGYLRVDDPEDRLLPTRERLQALRAFANHAGTALDAAARFAELRTAVERHEELIAAAPLAIADVDSDGRVRSWNPAAERMFGWRADEVIGRIGPWVPEERLAEFEGLRKRVLEGQALEGLELERVHRDGSPLEIAVWTAPLRRSDGVAGAVSFIGDVTERRRAERALVASEARTAAIVDAALEAVITLDHEGRIVEFNRAAEEIFGLTSRDAVGRDFLDLAIPGRFRDSLAETLRTASGPLLGARLEIEALRADGRELSAEIVLSRVSVEGPPLFAVCLRDVTRRKARDEQLRETAAKYRSLVEELPLATYVNELGLPIRTRWISPQIERILGFLPEEWLVDGFYEERLHPDDRERVLGEVGRTHLTGEPFRSEYRLLARDGRFVRVLDETRPVRDEEYRPLFLQGFLIDLGDRPPALS
jgi:PAS domain S-box-containing protein